MPSPPIRSASQPQNCRLTKAQPSSTDSIAAPCADEIPTSLQNATRWLDGIAIGTQHKNEAAHKQRLHAVGAQPQRPCRRGQPAAATAARLGCGAGRNSIAIGTISSTRRPNAEHRRLPAEPSERSLKRRGPDHPGDVLTRRDQRQCGAAAAVEPAADVDQQRRIKRAAAEQADEQRVAEIKCPDPADRRHRQAEGGHHRAKDHGSPNPDPVGNPAHQNAAGPGADPDQSGGESDYRAVAAECRGDRLQPDHDNQRRAVGDRQYSNRQRGHDPGRAALDAVGKAAG